MSIILSNFDLSKPSSRFQFVITGGKMAFCIYFSPNKCKQKLFIFLVFLYWSEIIVENLTGLML